MHAANRLLFTALLVASAAVAAAPVETEIPNVTAKLVELRTSGGVTRLAVRFINSGTKKAEAEHYSVGKIMLVDAKSKQKHFPLKDAGNFFIGGPIGDSTLDGGRIYVVLEAGQQGVAWAYFNALPAGTVVSVELPQMFPFEDVVVTEGAGTLLSASRAKSTPTGAVATLASAKRADEALNVQLTLAAEPGVTVDLRSPYFEYKDVYLFDPAGKRKYPLLKDTEGYFQAQPLTVKMGGGRFIPDWTKPILMNLAFQAPPDSVKTVDLILPDFEPFEGIVIEGLGSAGDGGIAATGKSPGGEGAPKVHSAVSGDAAGCIGADPKVGIAACTRLIEQSAPDSAERANAYATRAKHYVTANDLESALADANEALRMDPLQANALHNRGITYFYLGQNDKALADINKEIDVAPNDAEAYATRARISAESGQVDAAITDLNKALAIDPRHVDALNSRGAIYTMSGKMDAALADFNAVLAIDPKNADAYSSRGGMYLMTNRLPQALADLDQAIRLNPTDINALLNRGMTYVFQKRFDQAIADFTRALALEPGNAHLHFQRATAYFMSGRPSEALADADLTIRSQSDHLQAHQLRAAALEAMKRSADALKAHRRVLELDPSNQPSLAAVQRLTVSQ